MDTIRIGDVEVEPEWHDEGGGVLRPYVRRMIMPNGLELVQAKPEHQIPLSDFPRFGGWTAVCVSPSTGEPVPVTIDPPVYRRRPLLPLGRLLF